MSGTMKIEDVRDIANILIGEHAKAIEQRDYARRVLRMVYDSNKVRVVRGGEPMSSALEAQVSSAMGES